MRHLTSQQLTASADEQLSGVSLDVVRRHLGICPDCRTRLERFAHQREALREVLGADPGEAFWDELFERIETRLHTIDVLPERSRPSAPAPASTPTEARPAPTPGAPALRVITVSTLDPLPAPAAGSRAPLRGVWIGAACLVALLLAIVIAILRAPAPHAAGDTRLSWLPQLAQTIRASAVAIAAPLVEFVRKRPERPSTRLAGPAADLDSAAASIGPAPRPTLPAPIATPLDPPVALAKPAMPGTPAVTGRKPAPRVALPEPTPRDAPGPVPPPVERRPAQSPAATSAPPSPVVARPTPIPADEARWPLCCGQVLDAGGAPVAGARVQMADLDLGARTDRRGRFCLAMPPGARTLTISAMGFAHWRQIVDVSADTTELQVTLEDAR